MAIPDDIAEFFDLPDAHFIELSVAEDNSLAYDSEFPPETAILPYMKGEKELEEKHPISGKPHRRRTRKKKRQGTRTTKQERAMGHEDEKVEEKVKVKVEETVQQDASEPTVDDRDLTENGNSDDEDKREEDGIRYPAFSSHSPNAYRPSSEGDNEDSADNADEDSEDEEEDTFSDNEIDETEDSSTDDDEKEDDSIDEAASSSSVSHRSGSQPLVRRDVDNLPEPQGAGNHDGPIDGLLLGQNVDAAGGADDGRDAGIVLGHEIPPSSQAAHTKQSAQTAESNGKSSSKRHLSGDDDPLDHDQQASSKRHKTGSRTEGSNIYVGQMQFADEPAVPSDHSTTDSVAGPLPATTGGCASVKATPGTASGNWPVLRSTKTFSTFSLAEQSRTIKDWMAEVEAYVGVIQAGAIPISKISRFFRHVNEHLNAVTETLDDVALAARRMETHYEDAQDEMDAAEAERREIAELLKRFAPPSSTPAVTQARKQE